MADPELVRILREDGVEAWNAFVDSERSTNASWVPDLFGAHFQKSRLAGANLSCANLTRADLRSADLERADFREANLRRSDLSGANLRQTTFRGADLRVSNLSGANLTKAYFRRANLSRTVVRCAIFTEAFFYDTTIASVDLSTAERLASTRHSGPSALDNRTLLMSQGKIPEYFLRSCGFQDWEIVTARLYDPDLTDERRIDIAYQVATMSAKAPIRPNPIFISYTHSDGRFVDQLQDALDEKGIRSWRDVHNSEAGPLEKVIDRAISLNPTMVLVLSHASCGSSWVRYEIAKALELEQELGRAVLCPVAIDDAWLTVLPAQQRTEVKRYNVLDLSAPDAIEAMMPRLLKGLHIHYRDEKQAG